MKTMKTYAAPKWFWLFPVAVTLFGAGIFWEPYDLGPKLFVVALCLFAWWGFLTIPLEIKILEDESVLFKGVFTQTQVKVADIQAIEKGGKGTKIIHTGGKIHLIHAIPNLEEFYQEIKRLNPAITEDYESFTKFAQSPGNVALIIAGSVVVALIITAIVIIMAG